MAGLRMDIVWQRRHAIYRPQVDRPHLGIKAGDMVMCRVWGCFQVNDGEDINPYFVVELKDGYCTYVSPEHLQFIEKEEDEADDTDSDRWRVSPEW